jgi:xylose dehydrogenase (NAD/NADP)
VGVVRIGLLSTARINRHLLAQRSPAWDFAAVASRDRARADAYAAEWGIARAHGSYDELLADPQLDAVYIALPNALHHEWTLRALAAGKHVLCEKPYTRRPADVEEAWGEAERRGLVLMEAYMWRHAPQTALMLELLPRIGELRSLRSTFWFRLERDGDVRLDPALGGGSLLDVGCYCVGALRLLAGEPERVYGERTVGRGGVDAAFAGVLRRGDVLGTFTCGFTAEQRGIVVLGADGDLYAPDPWHASDARVYLNGEEHEAQTASPYLRQLQNFAAAVGGEADPLLGRADAVGQARALDALLRSADSAAPVSLV